MNLSDLGGEPGRDLLSGNGTWKISRCQEWWCIDLEIQPSVAVPNAPRKQSRYLLIIGEKPPYTLHIIVDDPDAGRALQFATQ